MERSWVMEQPPVASYEVSLSGEDGSNTIQLDINALANMPNTAATPNDDASSAFTVSALSGLVSRANTRCRASCTVQPNY